MTFILNCEITVQDEIEVWFCCAHFLVSFYSWSSTAFIFISWLPSTFALKVLYKWKFNEGPSLPICIHLSNPCSREANGANSYKDYWGKDLAIKFNRNFINADLIWDMQVLSGLTESLCRGTRTAIIYAEKNFPNSLGCPPPPLYIWSVKRWLTQVLAQGRGKCNATFNSWHCKAKEDIMY